MTFWIVLGLAYAGLGLLAAGLFVEDVVKRRFGWGCCRETPEDRAAREAEALVADRAVLLARFYD